MSEGPSWWPVVLYPDEHLSTRSRKVVECDDGLRFLVNRLSQTRRQLRGLGLSACQVGVGARVFVWVDGGTERCMVNPKVLEQEGEQWVQEGCLSIPGANVCVSRPQRLYVRGRNAAGEMIDHDVTGLQAQIMAHEIDHLNGRCVVDDPSVTHQQRKASLRQWEYQRYRYVDEAVRLGQSSAGRRPTRPVNA